MCALRRETGKSRITPIVPYFKLFVDLRSGYLSLYYFGFFPFERECGGTCRESMVSLVVPNERAMSDERRATSYGPVTVVQVRVTQESHL